MLWFVELKYFKSKVYDIRNTYPEPEHVNNNIFSFSTPAEDKKHNKTQDTAIRTAIKDKQIEYDVIRLKEYLFPNAYSDLKIR